jgi:hypothetical protein
MKASNFEQQISRRSLVVRSSTIAFGASLVSLSGCGGGGGGQSSNSGQTDTDNFYLNLEFLLGQFYSTAIKGSSTTKGHVQSSATAKTGPVPFSSPFISNLANEFASEQGLHVSYLQTQLGTSAVASPVISLTNGFSAVGSGSSLGASFDPFSSDDSFLLGAFFLEELLVTATHGSAESSPAVTTGLLGNHCYHAGVLRTVIAQSGPSLISSANAIVTYGNNLGMGGNVLLETSSGIHLAPVNPSGNLPSRSPQQILAIIYNGTGGISQSFFPSGLNGTIH